MGPLPIRDYMTPLPQTVDVEQPLSVVLERMLELDTHHLPVTRENLLVGIISIHDVEMARTLGMKLEHVSAGVGMTAGPYVVGPDTPLPLVARTMARRHLGCALVMEGQRVVGILTTTDALGLLADFVTSGDSPVVLHSKLPSATAFRIRHEHDVLRGMLQQASSLADRVLREDSSAETELRKVTAELYQTLLRHIDLEDTLLVPVLMEVPTTGQHRADSLLEHHREQREQIQMLMSQLDTDPEHLARAVLALVGTIGQDMQHEEQDLLTSAILHDDPTQPDSMGG
jgi:acetoin utilization protein AcuB